MAFDCGEGYEDDVELSVSIVYGILGPAIYASGVSLRSRY